MKRLVFAILLVAAVAAAVFLALNRPGAEASPDVTITVSHPHDVVAVRDGMLTLREAMMLATGDLWLIQLGFEECVMVSGAVWVPIPDPGQCVSSHLPGAASADTIVFDLFPADSVVLGGTLPALDTGDDTVDGSADVIIWGAGADEFDCFEITSNSNTIKGLAITNCDVGVNIHAGAQHNTIGGSTEPESDERNVISANDVGVHISGVGTEDNTVKGNYIGTDDAGTFAMPNRIGVAIRSGAQDNTIGGSSRAERNVISGNVQAVQIDSADGNVVKGNYIGTNASGTAAVPNDNWAVHIRNGAQNNTVGGSGPSEGNVISGNRWEGVFIQMSGTAGNTVKGNFIGTNASGTAPLPNGAGVGIGYGAHNNTIGGNSPGEGNVIAFNDSDGVLVDGADTTGNTIRGNSIHSNGGKGIELVDGGNTELAPPVVTGFGSVMGTACPGCTIDIYSDDEDEGRVYEGAAIADGSGNWSFSGSPQGPNVTATATDSDGNTSEFSAPVVVPEPAPTPSPTATPSPTPTATPTPTPSPTPPVGPTRSMHWRPGWHNATWSGSSTPEEAFACAAGNYAAAYRYVGGSFERYFPDRLDISDMGDLEQYDPFFILMTGDVTCEMAVADPPGTERTLDWGVGWNNDGWTGADGTSPQDAFACADGSYTVAYRLVGGDWQRYFPDRPDISNMGPLAQYDAFLIQVTAPVSCSMAIAP